MQLRGIKKLIAAVDSVKEKSETVRSALEDKQQWLETRSDKYQESEAGQAWEEYLNSIEELLDRIDELDVPDFE